MDVYLKIWARWVVHCVVEVELGGDDGKKTELYERGSRHNSFPGCNTRPPVWTF